MSTTRGRSHRNENSIEVASTFNIIKREQVRRQGTQIRTINFISTLA